MIVALFSLIVGIVLDLPWWYFILAVVAVALDKE